MGHIAKVKVATMQRIEALDMLRDIEFLLVDLARGGHRKSPRTRVGIV
jgi:hypothetical protein